MKNSANSLNPELNLNLVDRYKTLKSKAIPRSFIISLIIGSMLNLINQYDGILGANELQILPLLLTYITPFMVVLISQRTSLSRAWQNFCQSKTSDEIKNIFSTLLSHKIPSTAFTLGIVFGSINTAILVYALYLDTGELSMIPLSQMSQFYFIPMLFGVLSQALSYRRAMSVFTKC